MFNYANGKCVSQNSYEGQQLLRVKKYNDAVRARAAAQKMMERYEPIFDKSEKDQATFGAMKGDLSQIAASQRAYEQAHREFQLERQRRFDRQQRKVYLEQMERLKLCPGKSADRPHAKSNSF